MKHGVALLTCLLVTTMAFAQQPPADKPGSEEKELADLLSIIQQETDVATKTRINSDYVPGIVTVLQGDDLEALGIGTAGEALGLVPGMQSVLDVRGVPAVIVRGIDFPFNSGNIQILVNSIPIVRADSGVNAAVLLMPVEQIERIEVIRGPGSVIYGDFAFMGLVNIITRQEAQRIHGRVDDRVRTIGGRAASKNFSINLSRGWSDDAPAQAPARNVDEDRTFGIATAKAGGFSLTAQAVRRTFEAPAGVASPHFDEKSWVLDGRYARNFTPALHGEASVTHVQNDIDDTVSIIEGDLTKVAVNAVWTGLAHQSWLAGADYTNSTIDRAAHAAAPTAGGPPPPLQELAHDVERNITGFTLQDRIDLHDAFSLTLGARYDTYSDLDSRITPRASIVWRASDRHILKAQYAEGFRPPTFFELYQPPAPRSNPRYPFEVNATTEMNYVYRAANRVGRATLFRSSIHDMIRPGGVVVAGNARATGVELEWSQQATQTLKIDTNASWVHTTDPRVPGAGRHDDPITATVLGNVALFYRPFRDTIAGVRWNHVGDRGAFDGYDTIDFSVSRQDLFFHGFGVRAGVKNVLDDDIAYLSARPTGEVAQSVFPGRSVWLQLSWKR